MSPKKSVSNIDCFNLIFPENDPAAATAYEKLVATMFDFEIPEDARERPFSAETQVYWLPDVTVSKMNQRDRHGDA